MHNNSPMEAEVHFCFQHDTKATTYLLDPPSMTLKPKEKKVGQSILLFTFTFTSSHLADAFVQSDVQGRCLDS